MGVLVKENGLSTKKATSRKSVCGTVLSNKFYFLYFAINLGLGATFSSPSVGEFEK